MRRRANTEHREFNHHIGGQLAGWTAAIADQVKNPVAGIAAAAAIIEKQMAAFRANASWDPAIVEEAVRLMQQRLSRFDNYLSELSGFTRAVVLQPVEIPIAKDWQTIHQFILRRMHTDVHIQVHFDEGIQTVYADPEKLRSMLLAAVLNSTEAQNGMELAEVSINFARYSDVDVMAEGVVITIRDYGTGFSEEALLHGFVPFFTTKEAGAGLGLAMIDKYARAHGGWAQIDNWGGEHDDDGTQGADVRIFLPKRGAL